MNKKAYEAPEMIARMIATYNLAANDISTGETTSSAAVTLTGANGCIHLEMC